MDSEPQPDERRHLLDRSDAAGAEDTDEAHDKMGWVQQNRWIVLAIASGACAAFNGVFAKLYVNGRVLTPLSLSLLVAI